MWAIFKWAGVVGGLSVILCVGIVGAARQNPPENHWLVYLRHMGLDGSQLYIMSPDGSQKVWISHTDILSNNGTNVYFGSGWVLFCENGQLYQTRSDGKMKNLLSDVPCHEFRGLSPDGKWVYFYKAITPTGPFRLFRMRLNGEQRQLVFENRIGQGLRLQTWSPDGEWLYLGISASPGQDYRKLARLRPDGSDFQLLVNESRVASVSGWSPDKQWLILSYFWDTEMAGLYRIRPDGTLFEKLTDEPASNVVGWSSDGEWLIYYEQYRLMQLNLRTREQRPFSIRSITSGRPTLSPDGQWIAYETYSNEAGTNPGDFGPDWHVISLDGWVDRRVTYDTPPEDSMLWSPDGNWFYFGLRPQRHMPSDLYRVRVDGTGKELMINDAMPLGWSKPISLDWQPSQLAIIGFLVWGAGVILPFLRRRQIE